VTERRFRLDVRTGAGVVPVLYFRTIQFPQGTHKNFAHTKSPIFLTLRLFPFAPHFAAHHVWPTMPPPSARGYALCASSARKPQSYASRARLFRCVKSKPVWSPWSSVKVGTTTSSTHGCARLTLDRRPGQLSSQRLWSLEQTRSYAETIVKVPEMAESITEGTLKQWSKRALPF
jgi:hypothetical protein